MKITYAWQNWHITLWQTDDGWQWVAAKEQRWIEGDGTGTLAQVKLLLAAELQRRDNGDYGVEEN